MNKPISILIVEAKEDIFQMVSQVTFTENHIMRSSNSREALTTLQNKDINLILADTEQLKDEISFFSRLVREESPKTLIVLVGSQFDEKLLTELFKLNVFDLITKPIRKTNIQFALRRATKYSRILGQTNELKEIIDEKNHELAISRNNHRELLEKNPEGIVVVDANNKMIYVNSKAESMFGKTRESLIGAPFDRVIKYQSSNEVKIVKEGKGCEFAEANIAQTTWSEEKVQMIFLHDLTSHKNVERELETARKEALESSKLKSEFLANMSHEIRTPITAILGFADLLHESSLSHEQADFLNSIRFGAHSLLNLINDILDLSKIEAGKIDFESVDFNLYNIVEEVCEFLAPLAHSKGLELNCKIDPRILGEVSGDPHRIKQILINIGNNAIKFTQIGEVNFSVIHSDSPTGSSIVISVEDTGIGIAPNRLDDIFEKFSQADSATNRKYGGTGLGLAICRKLAEFMNGQIEVQSEQGVGSRFTVTLPLTLKKPSPRMSSKYLESKRIALCDDNETAAQYLASTLESWGAAVSIVTVATKLLPLLKKASERHSPFDLVICDLNMPFMNGKDVAASINTSPALQGIQIILLTWTHNLKEIQDDQLNFINAVLRKPVKLEKIKETLNTVFQISPPKPAQEILPLDITRENLAPQTKILIVDDVEMNRKMVKAMLKKRDYLVDTAENGRIALECFQPDKYAAILMDCQMPEMDGFEATEKIRIKEEGLSHTPIIAMTARNMTGNEQSCVAAGMDDYITKPAKMDDLLSMVQKWVVRDASGQIGKSVDYEGHKHVINRSHHKIVVVDDEADHVELICSFLEGNDYKVFPVKSGQEALKLILSESIDIVVTDIRMPEMTGIELLQKIKEFNPTMPRVILMTGFDSVSLPIVYEKGADAIISKPFRYNSLIKKIDTMLIPKEHLWFDGRGPVDCQLQMTLPGGRSYDQLESIQLGQGGFFISTPPDKKLPQVGENVHFNIDFSNSNLQSFAGTGIVRWTRSNIASNLLSGLGIEIISLEEKCLSQVADCIAKGVEVAYIPIGALRKAS